MPDVIVVGAGHNGLVCACYLARAGLDVLVLEQADGAGGGSRTDETVPGYRFDTHSAAHNIINMTAIPAELALAEVGLEYRQMDPFAASFATDGTIVRFHRSVEATCASIAEHSGRDAEAYGRLLARAMPLIEGLMAGVDAGATPSAALRKAPRRAWRLLEGVVRSGGPSALASELAGSYAALLDRTFAIDEVKAPIAAFAAHASASPTQTGSALFALWQAAYHLYGQWHAVGGAQGLVDALVTRLTTLGGEVRTSAPVERIVRDGARVRGVVLESAERIAAPVVVTAVEPRMALLHLLDPPLDGAPAADLAAAHAGNAVQMLVHVAVDRPIPYAGARPGDHAGLQSYVDTVEDLVRGFAAADDRRLPDDPVPTYAFTTSALDDTLAPAGHHTVYLACPCAPFTLEGGWGAQAEGFAERMIATVEARAPGFRDSIVGTAIRTPEDMAAQLRWPGAHPMVLDITLDQLAWMRPTRALATHAVPGVRGLFVSGGGTAPMGGIAGTPGRATAKAVLDRHGSLRRGSQRNL